VWFNTFHYLDVEIEFFDIINTKAKGIGSSLSRYLKRNNDNLSWIETQLIIIISENYNFSCNQLNKTEISKCLTNIQNINW